jgi:hypothetical protein
METRASRLGHRSFRQFEAIFEQKMTEENLHLVGGEEAAWTRMLAVSEAQVIWTRTNQLCNAFVTGSLPHVVEPIAVPAWLTTPVAPSPSLRVSISLWLPQSATCLIAGM